MLAVLHIEDIWPVNKGQESEKVFGTADHAHPGVDYLFSRTGGYYIGGPIEGLQAPLHFAFRRHRHTPLEMKRFTKAGMAANRRFSDTQSVAPGSIRNDHSGHGRGQRQSAFATGCTRVSPGDIDTYTRIRCYLAAAQHYPPNMMLLSLLPLTMRMAGPREALLHAIIRKNYGCTHFIVGRDHAGPGLDGTGNGILHA